MKLLLICAFVDTINPQWLEHLHMRMVTPRPNELLTNLVLLISFCNEGKQHSL